jgi:hypothetical protein
MNNPVLPQAPVVSSQGWHAAHCRFSDSETCGDGTGGAVASPVETGCLHFVTNWYRPFAALQHRFWHNVGCLLHFRMDFARRVRAFFCPRFLSKKKARLCGLFGFVSSSPLNVLIGQPVARWILLSHG